MALSYLTAGESHGKGYVGIIEGIPFGVCIDVDFIQTQLKRRREALGRGGRQQVECDKVEIFAGVYNGMSTGAPIAIVIKNIDEWDVKEFANKKLTKVRPGHGDFAGAKKFRLKDARLISERGSARQTVMSVAIGAICKMCLMSLGIKVFSYVCQMGDIVSKYYKSAFDKNEDILSIIMQCSTNNVGWLDTHTLPLVLDTINMHKQNRDTLGGKVQLIATNMPIGIGGFSQSCKRIDFDIAANLMAINAVKSVQIGLGDDYCSGNGSDLMDAIFLDKDNRIYRKTNFAGGIEGGMTNGENIIVTLTFKPIPSVPNIATIDIESLKMANTNYERGDVTAVFAGGIVAENIFAYVLLKQILDYCNADTIDQLKQRLLV